MSHTYVMFLLGVSTVALATSVAASSLSSGQANRAPRQVVLRDESDADAAFAAFKHRLLDAASAGNVPVLLESMAASVNIEYDPIPRDEVLRKVGVTSGSPWRSLRDALRVGVVQEGKQFVAPSTAGLDLQDGEAVIIARDVHVRKQPRTTADAIGRLSLSVVELDSTHEFDDRVFETADAPQVPAAWAKVFISKAETGYVYGRFVRTRWSRRFVFDRRDGVWMLTAFAVSD